MRLSRCLQFALLATTVGLTVTLPVVGADPKVDKKAQQQKLKEEAAAKRKAERLKQAEEARKAEEAKAAAEVKAAEEAEAARRAELARRRANRPASTFDSTAAAKLIDTHVERKLAAEKLDPSELCDDAAFVRRAFLDITGVIPTAEKAAAFIDDKSPDKRAKLIDELLADPNYGRKQADIWLTKLFIRDSNNRFVLPGPFYAWLQDEFNVNTPWDEFVSAIITASGGVDEHPEVTFFLANRSIDKLTDAVSQHFLGVRLSCAQCHNHPFTATKQTEYWGMAGFFSKVVIDRPRNTNQGGDNSKIGVKEGAAPSKAKDFFPESAKKVNAKFLGGDEPTLDARQPFRPALAEWMTARDNPFFARAMVNRTWAQLFGSGIVDPVDDLIETNEPSHPELLDELAQRFAEGGFDVKALIRGICLSRTYQRSARPNGSNKGDTQYFSHMTVKQMSGEQLYDSLQQVLGADRPAAKNARPAGRNALSRREQFVQFYLAGAEESDPTTYEAGIPQVLKQLNGNNGQLIAATRTIAARLKPDAALEQLYLATLSRRPTAAETERLSKFVAENPTEGYADILWAILNSSEFVMVR